MATTTVIDSQRPRRIEKRRRSQVIKLRLLPQAEEERLRVAVAESGFPSIQAYLLATLPEIAAPGVMPPGSCAPAGTTSWRPCSTASGALHGGPVGTRP